MPFHDKLPGLLASIDLNCEGDYKCKVCYGKNACYSKAVERIRMRAFRKTKKILTDFQLFHLDKILLGESEKAILDGLKDVFLTWGE